MDTDGMYFCVDCGHKTENRGNWFKHRRKHLGKYVVLVNVLFISEPL
jgi:hypothetical protein